MSDLYVCERCGETLSDYDPHDCELLADVNTLLYGSEPHASDARGRLDARLSALRWGKEISEIT